jgi:hypothetical protein
MLGRDVAGCCCTVDTKNSSADKSHQNCGSGLG